MTAADALTWAMRGVGITALLAHLEMVAVRRAFGPGGPFGRRTNWLQFRSPRSGNASVRPSASAWHLAALIGVSIAAVVAIVVPVESPLALPSLLVIAAGTAAHLLRYPYGHDGSDQMVLAVSLCVMTALVAERYGLPEVLGPLSVAVLLGAVYAASGWSKLWSPSWRNGAALQRVLGSMEFGNDRLARLGRAHPRSVRVASWGVVAWEAAFGATMFVEPLALAAIAAGVLVHVSIAAVMGLNRFVPVFVGCYPCVAYASAAVPG